MLSKRKYSWGKMEKLLSIRNITNSYVLQNLPFIYAWDGCDSTSAVFSRGKCEIIKLIHKAKEIQSSCSTSADTTPSPAQLVSVLLRIFVKMYGEKPDDTLDSLRYIKYTESAATSTKMLQPERLLSSEFSGLFYSLRVHLQVLIWNILCYCQLFPWSWGWEMRNGILSLVFSKELIKFLRCKFKILCKIPCSTSICSCRNMVSCA